MTPRPPIRTALARLVPAVGAADRCRYRPLVAGPAILRRAAGESAWTVAVHPDGRLRPRAPGDPAALARIIESFARRGIVCRIGAALAGPPDAALPGVDRRSHGAPQMPPRRLHLDFYGWALMYQPPGMRGRAVVDADDRFPDLPAVFELPLEFIDRAEFLESRGIRTRPLVIPTRPEDFDAGPDGRLRNRFYPQAPCRRPCGLDRLL